MVFNCDYSREARAYKRRVTHIDVVRMTLRNGTKNYLLYIPAQ